MVISIITRIIVGVILSFHLPLNAAAQKSGTKIPHIGYIGMTPRPPDEAFRKGLQELGYNEGQNIVIEYHWIERSGRTAAQEADDLVHSKPDVIVAVASPSTRAVKDATGTIPIVFVDIGDPVANGFVTNLARPGGNLTGVSAEAVEIGNKGLQILKEVVPNIERVAVISNPDNPGRPPTMKALEIAASTVGVRLTEYPVLNSDDLTRVFDALMKERPDGLYVSPDHFLFTQRERLVEFASKNRFPAMYGLREYVLGGGLMAIGPNRVDMFRRAASYVDRILKGARPADLPVEQPTRFELILNMKTATGLGLSIPRAILLGADEVIE
jgi:putative ABC transport system substrate-binding protein